MKKTKTNTHHHHHRHHHEVLPDHKALPDLARLCPTTRLCPISRGYARPRGFARSREALPAISYRRPLPIDGLVGYREANRICNTCHSGGCPLSHLTTGLAAILTSIFWPKLICSQPWILCPQPWILWPDSMQIVTMQLGRLLKKKMHADFRTM